MYASIHAVEDQAALLACAQVFSPRVEQTAADTVVLDISGLERIYGMPQEIAAAIARRTRAAGLHANIAVAGNPDAAVHAARAFHGISVIPYGEEGKFLADLPLAALDPAPEIAETLERWGIRRFRDLAALPEIGLAGRLGEEGLRLQRLARGEAERPLVPVQEGLCFEETLEPEYPVDLLEPLAFLLARLLNTLCEHLAARAMAANELRLRLKLENHTVHERTLRLPVAMRDPRTFLKLLQLDLSAHPPAAPVTLIQLAAEPVKPRAAQGGLFIPLAPEPEKLEITLARIAALVGEANVGSAELLDTHRPGAFRMRKFGISAADPPAPAPPQLALRHFRPPRPARVQLLFGRPAHVWAEGVKGNVLTLAGPWRTSGNWWTRDPWSRDEWDLTLQDGALYRVVCEAGWWFVEGVLD